MIKEQGLYSPLNERENCGAGFICSLTGKKTNKIIKIDKGIFIILNKKNIIPKDAKLPQVPGAYLI